MTTEHPSTPELARKAWYALRGTGKIMELQSSGISMEPLIPGGSTLHISLDRIDKVQAGDIILFGRAGHFVLHRVVHIASRHGKPVLIEKGDHQLAFTHVAPDEYLGRLSSADTPDGRFDPASDANRRLTRRFLRISRVELRAYMLKQQLFGPKPSPLARPVIRLGQLIRRLLSPRNRSSSP
ncbi:MAG: hypothetical protein HQ559_02645 [Lentisphaerae bacterium]|nr:hypothetical protein [Lentisphaerota bacterium]